MNLQNLVDYCEWKNIDLFEGCTVPAPIDITMVKNEIMKRCGLLTPVYTEPEVFKALCKMWFDANQYNFDHLVKIMEAEYSPIENVAEFDWWKEENSGKDTSTNSGKDVTQNSGKDVDQLSGSDDLIHGAATEHTVSAFNDASYQPDAKDATSGTDSTRYGKKDEFTHGKKEEFTHGKKNEFEHGHNIEYNRYRHGNIGVTTNNKLETEEVEWLERFNPYDWIAAKFERENFVMIY